MPKLVSELIVSLDMCARGTRSPGYYGYSGPEFDAWIRTNSALPHRQLLGRKTYEMLNNLPGQARDDAWEKMTRLPGWLFSRTLKRCDWPGLEIVSDDLPAFLRRLKADDGSELRILGSLSLVRQTQAVGLLDLLKLIVCPLAVPQTGVEPVFAGWADTAFDLVSVKQLDGRVQLLEYRPVGAPPSTEA
jgi:dihydrofolate reductase